MTKKGLLLSPIVTSFMWVLLLSDPPPKSSTQDLYGCPGEGNMGLASLPLLPCQPVAQGKVSGISPTGCDR